MSWTFWRKRCSLAGLLDSVAHGSMTAEEFMPAFTEGMEKIRRAQRRLDWLLLFLRSIPSTFLMVLAAIYVHDAESLGLVALFCLAILASTGNDLEYIAVHLVRKIRERFDR